MVKSGDIVRFRSDVKILGAAPGEYAIVLGVKKRWSYIDDADFTYIDVMRAGYRDEWPAESFEGYEHGLFNI